MACIFHELAARLAFALCLGACPHVGLAQSATPIPATAPQDRLSQMFT